ncbi:MAG TPA: hypothetical protein VLL08_10120 [Kineosporiaceae bacterium]|nr:hypothetical protein [Kineosporiaceae bacterium]
MSITEEPPNDEPADPGRSKVAHRLLNQPLRNLGVGVAVVVLGTTAAFGGLERAAGTDRLAPVKVGVKTRVEPYDITLNRVVWVDDLPNVYPSERGNRWLAITATIRNLHEVSLYGAVELAESVTLSDVDGLVRTPEPDTDRVRSSYQKLIMDNSDLHPVQPSIDYKMVFLFEQKAGTPAPDRVKVELVGHTWREDSIDKTEKWLDPTVIAESTVPMIQLSETSG